MICIWGNYNESFDLPSIISIVGYKFTCWASWVGTMLWPHAWHECTIVAHSLNRLTASSSVIAICGTYSGVSEEMEDIEVCGSGIKQTGSSGNGPTMGIVGKYYWWDEDQRVFTDGSTKGNLSKFWGGWTLERWQILHTCGTREWRETRARRTRGWG